MNAVRNAGAGARSAQTVPTAQGNSPIASAANSRKAPGAAAESPVPSQQHAKRSIVAIGGGKGGIGKSFLSANLGVMMAQRGRRVVLVDADLGGANLHTCLGIPPPAHTLSDFIGRKVPQLGDVISETNVPGLGLISGALDVLGAANPKHTQKLRLLREISKLDVDHVIIDLGGGTGFNILDFFLIAEHGVLTVVPEPTSIENAYRFIKAAYYRRLKTLELSLEIKPVVEAALRDRDAAGLKTPADLVRYVERENAEAGEQLRAELEKFPLKLVVNQARGAAEEKLGESISAACRKYFGIPMNFLGAIPYDDDVWRSVRKRRPVMIEHPDGTAATCIRHIAARMGMLR